MTHFSSIEDNSNPNSPSRFSITQTPTLSPINRPPTQRVSVTVMQTPVIAITEPPDQPAKHETETKGIANRRSKSKTSLSLLAPPKMRRCKSASVESELSVLSSPIVMHDSEGQIRVYSRRRAIPDIIQDCKDILTLRDKRVKEIGNKRRTEAKTAKKSSYIVLTFLAIWLPLPIAVGISNYYVHHHNNYVHLQWYLDFQLLAFCFGMLTVVTNPIIYGLAIKSFRVAFVKLARSDWTICKRKCICK